jgi:hypothetical protein
MGKVGKMGKDGSVNDAIRVLLVLFFHRTDFFVLDTDHVLVW